MNKEQLKQQVIDQVMQLQDEGYTFTQACQQLNMPRSTVWDWVNNRKRNISQIIEDDYYNDEISDDIEIHDPTMISSMVSNTPLSVPNVFSRNKKFQLQEENYEDIKNFIASLAPIQYPAPPKPTVYKQPNKYAMVIGDTHFGMENWDVLNLFLSAVEEIKPSMVVLNGDTLDMFAISRYPKDIRYTHSLKHEREQYHKFLKMLHDVTEPYQTKIYETNANHSGDGVEGRWWRYLSEAIGEIIDIPGVRESMSYKNVFFPQDSWNRTELVDVVELCDVSTNNQFVIMHGDVVRRHGGYSARGVLEKWFTSAMVNHTHRIGMTPQTFPAIGSKKEVVIRVYENGCACSLKPDYASAANWQNAFSIINYDDFGYSVETPVITNRTVAVSTLGKTLKV
jgi:hypothetical protein